MVENAAISDWRCIIVVQSPFSTFTSLFHEKCNLLKARVIIYACRHHVRLLSPEPLVVGPPKSTRVEEPKLLCNQVVSTCLRCAWRRRVERRRRTAHRAQGQTASRHVRPKASVAARVAPRIVREAATEGAADSERSRLDELGGRGQGKGRSLLSS